MRQSLIFSRASNNGILDNVGILSRAPAVFATSKAGHLTDRYHSLRTADLLPVLADYGYAPTQAAQKRSRKAEGAEHAGHLLAFSKTDNLDGADGIRPEIVLYNSHDGTGAVKLYAGVYRFICSNGIIAGDGFASTVYHSKHQLSGFEEMLKKTIETLPEMMTKIDQLRNIKLSYEQSFDLASRGVLTRWESLSSIPLYEDRVGCYAVSQTTSDALKITRSEDDYYDAWTVLQRVQEAVIRGNTMVRSLTVDNPDGVMRKARPINSVKKAVSINQQLWNIAEEVALA